MALARPTYVTDRYRLGSLGCPACGHLFPLATNAAAKISRCAACGLSVYPDPALRDVNLTFDASELRLTAAAAEIQLRSGVEVADTRTTEQAFCDKCRVVRKCFVFAQQTRSADEGQTVFYECSTCTNQWSLNS